MRKSKILLVLVCFGICALGVAETVSAPAVTVLQDRGSSITIEFALKGYEIEPVDINGLPCSRITLPGQVTFLEKGMPQLPTIARNVIVPDDALMGCRIVAVEYERIEVNTVIPSKGSLSRAVDPNTVPYTFDKFYQTDSWWPEKTVEIYEPFILRDYRGVTIRFNPFQYNPAKNELKIAKRVVVEVYVEDKGGANVITEKRGSIAREFVNIYKSNFLNFRESRYDSIAEREGRMVIIAADAYMSNMEDFKVWKRMKGIETKMVPISSIGNSEANIKNFIQSEYNAGDLVWVLLVGDGNEVVPATGTIGWAVGEAADPVYAYTAGSDYYPDIFISRFSSRGGNSINIDKQASRSIEYEKTPQAGADWYHIGLGVASAQSQGGPADSTRCNWLRDSLLDYYYTEVNKSYDYWGTSSLIKSFIEAGTSIINYIGHGGTTSWSNGGGFSISDINDLDNPWMLPFVISVACLVGNFDGPDCYCEASVTAGTVEEPDGFLVHWGSSINQHWDEPCAGQEGAVNLLTHDQKNSFGGICFNGACYMIEYYAGSDFSVDMAQTWTIFGDASLQLRTNTPQSMTVNHAAVISVGQTTFDVSVPGVQDALVGLYIDTLLVGSGFTDASGDVTINVDPAPSNPGDTMYITVTNYNHLPYESYAMVIVPSGPYLMLASLIVDDAGGNDQANPGEVIDLGIWAKNIGVETAYNVYGLLSESDVYASMDADSSWYGNIPDNDSSLSSPYYSFTVTNDCPNNHTISFTLELHDFDDSTWTFYPSVTVYAPILTYQDVTVVNDDNGDGILDPGETADLVVTIENEGGANAENVTSTLLTSSSYITINDNSGGFGSVDTGATGDNAGDPYTVAADGSTPNGIIAQFEIEVVSGAYVDTLEFSIDIGKKHYYLWNPDPTPTPGQKMDSILTDLGYSGDYGTSLAPDLSLYQSVLVCVGIYSNNYLIGSGSPEAAALVDFLENHDGRMYLEGGDVWYWDPFHAGGYNFGPLFSINGTADGHDDLGPVVGESGTFTEGMDFAYGGENSFIDLIDTMGTGFQIFHDGNDNYICGVANDPGTYRTVGTTFELGLLNDGDAPSTRAALLDSIMKFFGIGIPEVIPPSAPYIVQTEKSGDDVMLTWNKVTTDTTGNAKAMDCYVVYRNTSPSFVPSSSDSIGAVLHPETTYTDVGALTAGESYYYLVKAVDESRNMSNKSNMAYVFCKFVNENATGTDKNWVSLACQSKFDTVSDLTDDVSPSGDPLVKVTNLRDDQLYESWSYTTVPIPRWTGTNFTIQPGRGYEMVAVVDDTLVLVGCNDPNGLVSLNENAGLTDKNLVSIPYNAVYGFVEDITDEYASSGDPLVKVTNLRDDQLYESWSYTTIPTPRWTGTNFGIEAGRGYEFVVIVDTTWNPTEYSNEASGFLATRRVPELGGELYVGTLVEPDRVPVWSVREQSGTMPALQSQRKIDYLNAQVYVAVERSEKRTVDHREVGISHLVRGYCALDGFEHCVFTVYRPDRSDDVLTENMVGSGILTDGDGYLFWFDVGNFQKPWYDQEEVILIIEASRNGKGYFSVVNFTLDRGVDIQELGELSLVSMPELKIEKGMVRWDGIDNENIVGYSLYEDEKRLNEKVITTKEYAAIDGAHLKPVIKGGHETVYGAQGSQSVPQDKTPRSCAFSISQNPFTRSMRMFYQVSEFSKVSLKVYDAAGRIVRTLADGVCNPGYYTMVWNGRDNMGRKTPAGIYFVCFETDSFKKVEKAILLK